MNNSDEEKTVSITFTFQNGVGEKSDRLGGCWTEGFRKDNLRGQIIHHKIDDMDYSFAVASSNTVDFNIFSPSFIIFLKLVSRHCELSRRMESPRTGSRSVEPTNEKRLLS